MSFKNIFGQGVSESYKTLYVPAFIPFVITVWLSLIFFRVSFRDSFKVYYTTLGQTIKPLLALFGALVMVKFMMVGGDNSMVKTIGNSFAQIAGTNWAYFASYLGAIGAFFSGSNTVSNLTFGSIQHSIATQVHLPTDTVLALQSVGGAMGNMVCINNIIAVCSVLDVQNQEGAIIKKTAIPMFYLWCHCRHHGCDFYRLQGGRLTGCCMNGKRPARGVFCSQQAIFSAALAGFCH